MRAHRHVVSWIGCVGLLVVGLLFLCPSAPSYADVGPKPQMHFAFTFEGDPLTIVSGQLIECEDETCAGGQPLEELGPQSFTCTESDCSSAAYGYAPYHKIAIEFEDRARESNVFAKEAFNARYEVTVSEANLEVVEVRRGLRNCLCCPSILVTLVLETLVASEYLRAFRLPRAALPWVPMVSLLTLPFVWFVFPQISLGAGWVTALSEAFAVLCEAGLLYLAAMRTIPLKHAALLSVAMNAASFGVGLLL